jgi:ATP-binding cassette subfamily B protein
LIAADGLYAEMWRRQSEAVAAAEAAAIAQAQAQFGSGVSARAAEEGVRNVPPAARMTQP